MLMSEREVSVGSLARLEDDCSVARSELSHARDLLDSEQKISAELRTVLDSEQKVSADLRIELDSAQRVSADLRIVLESGKKSFHRSQNFVGIKIESCDRSEIITGI